jgi:RHS repeat-associated protein
MARYPRPNRARVTFPHRARRQLRRRALVVSLVLALPLLLGVATDSPAKVASAAGQGTRARTASGGLLSRNSVSPNAPPLYQNKLVPTPDSPGAVPATPILDDFNRPDEFPLSQGGNWAPYDPQGGGDLVQLISNQASWTGDERNVISFRVQNYSADLEAYATITAKPQDGTNVSILINLTSEGSSYWDGYMLSWDAIAGGTDVLRFERITDNGVCCNLVTTNLEMHAGDKLLARRIGETLEGYVNQGSGWVKAVEAQEPYYIGGKVGIHLAGASPHLDDFGGGSLGGSPPPPGQSTGACDGSGAHAISGTICEAEPVNTLTGAYTTYVTDLQLPGIGLPFAWTRSYTSSDATTGRLGLGWTDSYAAFLTVQPNGDLLLHGEEGQQVYYTKQPDGSFVGARGAVSVLTTEGSGHKLVRRDQVTYHFDDQGRLTSEKDRNNEGLSFAYDGQGQLQTITDSVNRQIAVTYLNGLVDQVTLPDGRYVQYGYTNGQLTSVHDARGGTTQYTYDPGGRLATIVDQKLHQVVRNVYDQTSGRVTDQYDALNHHSTFAWDAPTQTSTFTDARNHQWKDVYVDNLLVKRIDPLANTTQYAYDSDLNVTKVTDARNNATQMSYDGAGNMLTRTAPPPLSYQEVWTYTARNDPLTYKDGRGNTTDYGYDAAGNLTSVTGPDPDGGGPLTRPQTLYGRDPGSTGLLTSITDPRGKVTAFSYTDGNLTQIQTQLGNRTTMCYDTSGRMVGLVDPRGTQSCSVPNDYRWSYTYNEANQLRTQTDPLGNLSELDYDPAGNLLFRRDAKLHQTNYGYDDANHLILVTAPDPDGGGPLVAPATAYIYDEVGNLTTRTDANQHQTLYEYDNANRLTRVTSPASRVWTYGYDPNGNVTQVVDANGNATPQTGDGQTTYGYDVLNRLSSIDYSDTTPDVGFSYDGNGNRTQMTDGSGSESYVYDTVNRLTSVTRGSDVFSYAYDLVNLISATYPGQPAVSYAYDNDERLQSAGLSGQTTSYGYDAAGNLQTTTLPSGNGYVETRTYDRAGRLTDILNKKGATTLAEFAMSIDPAGNPTQVVRTGSLAQTQRYTYDGIDRITEACFQASACTSGSSPFIRWTYDGVGNRLTEARPTGTTNYAYNVADELTQAGSTSYTYNQNGNELSAGSRTFAYDLANRVKTTTSGNTTTTYTYDGDGKRLQASTGTQASKKTNFLWDVNQGLAQLALERDGNNALIRRYVYGQRRISQTAGSSTSYYLYDGLGSVANLTSSTGSTQWTWSYEPFGSIRTETKASGQQPDNFMKFTGEYLDPTALYHLRARQYDPASGRFLTRDPLRVAAADPTVSSYTYANNRPTLFVDPTGLRWCWKACGGYDAAKQFVRGVAAEPGKTVLAGFALIGAYWIATSGYAATSACFAAATVDPLLAIHCLAIGVFAYEGTAISGSAAAYLLYQVYQAGASRPVSPVAPSVLGVTSK